MKTQRVFILTLLSLFFIGCTVTAPDEPTPEVTSPPLSQVEPTVQASATMPATSTPPPVLQPSATATVTTAPAVTATATATATEPPPPTETMPSPEPEIVNQSDGRSNLPAISADGQRIAFTSAGALAAGTRGVPDALYLYDRATGTTTLVNRTLSGDISDFRVYGLALSDDGRYVAYYSHDGDLVPGDEFDCGGENNPTSCEDIFIFDSQTQETARVPVGRSMGLGKEYTLALSPDGRYVAYETTVLDWASGQSETVPTLDGQPMRGVMLAPQFADGDRLLAFVSNADNLVPDDNNETYDVFIWQRESGLVERVSVSSEGTEANDTSGALPFHEGVGSALAISADGNLVAFTSLATNLTDEAIAECPDFGGPDRLCYNLYLHDRQTKETRLITSGADGDSQSPSLSGDGRYLTFSTLATNLGQEALPACEVPFPAVVVCGQIYLLDIQSGQLILVSQTDSGNIGNKGSWNPQISAAGSSVAFVSESNNLVPDDTNEVSDIFVFDLDSGQLARASLKSSP